MNKHKKRPFKIGDRVFLTADHPDNNPDLMAGDVGTIVEYSDNYFIGVQFDFKITNGHNCCGNSVTGYGWYVGAEDLCFVTEEEYDMIVVSDEELTALLS